MFVIMVSFGLFLLFIAMFISVYFTVYFFSEDKFISGVFGGILIFCFFYLFIVLKSFFGLSCEIKGSTQYCEREIVEHCLDSFSSNICFYSPVWENGN